MTRRLDRIVVTGRDHAVWLAAAVLRGALGPAGVTVAAVELPADPAAATLGALATLPPLSGLHARIGLDPERLLQACGGTASLGVELAGFTGRGSRAFLPYGGHGPDVAGAPFASVYVRARRQGLRVRFEDFSLNAAAAGQGRFFLPSRETAAYTLCGSAAHLDAAAYARALKAQALALGVEPLSTRGATLVRDPRTGLHAGLRVDGGREVAGDLYVDCGGLDGGRGGWTSWRTWFPFDRLLTASAPRFARLPAHGRAQAAPHGVAHLRPLQDRTAAIFAFASDRIGDDGALREAAEATGLPLRDAAVRALDPGRRDAAWTGDVVALGEAACRFDPLFHPDLHILQLGLALLVTLLPSGGADPACARAFNRSMADAAERLRDLQIAPLALNRVQDSPLWTALRDAPAPEPLQEKLNLFAAIGEVALRSDETFLQDGWAALLLGLELEPGAWSPLADALPDAALAGDLQDRLRFVKGQVEAMSSHDAWIEMHAGAAHG